MCPAFALGVEAPLFSGRHGLVLSGDSPLSSGRQALVLGRTSQRLPKESGKTMLRGGERGGVMLKRNDTDVGWWRWVEKGVSRFCHTPSALRARPPVSGGQSGCGRFFWLCPSKLGGRGAKRRRGYVSFPFSVSRSPFIIPPPPCGLVPLSQVDKVDGPFLSSRRRLK